MMNKNLSVLLVLVLIFSMILSACDNASGAASGAGTTAENGAGPAETDEDTQTAAEGDRFIRNTASSMGGIWYPMATAMNTIWQRNIEGVGCKVVPGNSSENVKLVANLETEVGWCHSIGIMEAFAGASPFDDGLDYEGNITHLATIHPAAIHLVVRRDSGITSLSELDGKVVGFGSIGSTLNAAIEDLLAQYGITQETIVNAGGAVLNVSNSEAATLMQDNQIDIYFSQSTYPSSDFQEMENQVAFIGIEDDQLEIFLDSHPNWKPATIPDGTYKYQDDDLDTFSSYVVLACNGDLDEELAYQMTKSMWENVEQIQEVSADAQRFMRLDIALTCADIIPLHPGAQRYYEEVGVM